MNDLLADPRRRNLAILGAAALVSVLLAVWGVYEQSASLAPKNARTEFFPGLAHQIRQAARIHIVKKDGSFDVNFRPSKGWVLPGKGDFPASYAEVNKLLVGLAAMQTIEPKTARADWFHFVDLDAPPKGSGTEIVVSDDHGHELAHLIVGKSEDIGDQSGAIGLFVRRPGEQQSWLVRAESQPDTQIADWLDKNVLGPLDRDKLQSTVFEQPDGKSFEVSRAKPSDLGFQLATPIPAGKELANPGAIEGLATVLMGFGFDDVKPAREIDLANPVRVTSRTFDGLAVTADVVHVGQDYWATLNATETSTKPEIAKQARLINSRTNGWAYKLDSSKGAQLTTTFDSLLKVKGAAAAPGGPAPVEEE
ncbi:MAG TPA: DUF4340 domain-containing protein [Rhizomicrobium sp.]|nr:DUF4340 domain-containing protein [Rhizomicrobium sp.]